MKKIKNTITALVAILFAGLVGFVNATEADVPDANPVPVSIKETLENSNARQIKGQLDSAVNVTASQIRFSDGIYEGSLFVHQDRQKPSNDVTIYVSTLNDKKMMVIRRHDRGEADMLFFGFSNESGYADTNNRQI
jgi:hypothetical protein